MFGKSQIISLVAVSCGIGAMFGCSGSSSSSGGTLDVGGSSSTATGGSSTLNPGGGSPAIGGASSTPQPTGGSPATGGAAATGGSKAATGGAGLGGAATGGAAQTGGSPATGGAATGGKASGGAATGGNSSSSAGGTATGGAATGGKSSSTGGAATGGKSAGGSTATGGTTTVGGSAATGGGTSTGPNCSATMPTGGTVHNYQGSWAADNGTAAGLGWGMWSNGTGGSITTFSTQAFSASWNNSQDFLAHLGLDFSGSKTATAYNSIVAQFVEKKSGTAGGFSMIGMYGWTQSPCVEWYINEDSYNSVGGSGTAVTIDGGAYVIRSLTTTGTGGANACESGHTGSWTQMISSRKTARQCGTITVSDHFKAWAAQGWSLGILKSVHINVETGGGTGSIDFPVASVTAN